MKDLIRKILREGFDFGCYLYHGTSDIYTEALLSGGFTKRSFWTRSEDLAFYYSREVVEEVGGEEIVLKVPCEKFDASKFEVDWPSVEEPITTIIEPDEEEWEQSDKTWQDCLDIYGSVIYEGTLKITEDEIEY